MLCKYLFLLFLIPLAVNAQTNQHQFDEHVIGHGWHPMERGEFLFNDVFTVVLKPAGDMNYTIQLSGLDKTTSSKFTVEGTAVLRLQNGYFELALGGDASKVTPFIGGMIVHENQIEFCASNEPFELTDEGMQTVRWYTSRF